MMDREAMEAYEDTGAADDDNDQARELEVEERYTKRQLERLTSALERLKPARADIDCANGRMRVIAWDSPNGPSQGVAIERNGLIVRSACLMTENLWVLVEDELASWPRVTCANTIDEVRDWLVRDG